MTFNSIVKDIKELKIQGAQNVAKESLSAILDVVEKGVYYSLSDFTNTLKHSKKILFNSRPTEPCMRNALNYVFNNSYSGDISTLKLKIIYKIKYVNNFFKNSNKKISEMGYKKIKKGYAVYTHCHSSTVMGILKKAKSKGINFEVHNTETRPLFQGRKTAKELSKLNILVHHYIDSAIYLALKKVDIVLIGCDAILSTGEIVNKIGTKILVEIAHNLGIPVYICTNSWKFDPLTIKGYEEKIEERKISEVWENFPKGTKVHNPAFDIISLEKITGIISELGIYAPGIFIEEVKRENPWMFN